MSAHKWWRIKYVNLIGSGAELTGRITAKELRFITRGGVQSNDPAKGISQSYFQSGSYTEKVGNLFDNNTSTQYHPSDLNKPNYADYAADYVGYVFDTPQEVVSISAVFRTESFAVGWAWRSAFIQYSDDGANWLEAGYVVFNKISYDDAFNYSTPIFALNDLATSTNNSHTVLNLSSLDESGSITADVIANGLPKNTMVVVHDDMTHQPVDMGYCGDDGKITFTGLDKNRLYYLTSICDIPEKAGVIQKWIPGDYDQQVAKGLIA